MEFLFMHRMFDWLYFEIWTYPGPKSFQISQAFIIRPINWIEECTAEQSSPLTTSFGYVDVLSWEMDQIILFKASTAFCPPYVNP
jgi:hypothetical protein